MSAQEEQWQDDQERDRQHGQGDHQERRKEREGWSKSDHPARYEEGIPQEGEIENEGEAL